MSDANKLNDDDRLRVLVLSGASLVFFGLYGLINRDPSVSGFCFLLGVYSAYRAIVELTSSREGLSFPNAYKVLIAVAVALGAVAVAVVISNAYTNAAIWGGFGENFGENIDRLVDAIIRLIEYLNEHASWFKNV